MMKLTKKDKYGMLLEILAEVELADKDMLVEFVQGEVNAIERKAEKAKERPRAKKEATMKATVLDALTDELQIGSDILAIVLNDFEDATQAKVTARLSSLVKEGYAVKENVKSDIRIQRAKHAVYENQRTVKAVDALQKNNVALFGELMNASHVSLRDDYEVTGIELDTLVEEAWKVEGVIGSRMTGAGFGGCTVSIVKEEAVENFIRKQL